MKINPEDYNNHFKSADPKIHDLIASLGSMQLPIVRDYYDALIRAIVGQQVSTKAAQAVYDKLLSRYNSILDPGILKEASQEELREAGISRQKHKYIVDLSTHFVEKPEIFEKLETLEDDRVIESLTAIKGIGVWTAQMFLMFTLRRMDVFPVDDLGIRTAMAKLYDFDRDATPKKLYLELSQPWAPYRSVASWYLWESLRQ